MQETKYIIVVIDGNIGVGKTSLLGKLEEKYPEKINVHFEPVETFKWLTGIDCLSEFYEGKRNKNFMFQLRVLQCSIENVKMALTAAECQKTKIQIIERGVLSCIYVFSENLYKTSK